MTSLFTIGCIGGLFACGHCLGMCGGFVLHLAREDNGRRMLIDQTLWQAGRITMYMFLGALAGYMGSSFEKLLPSWLQTGIGVTTGAAMLLAGLSLLGLLPLRGKKSSANGLAGPLLAPLFATPNPGSALLLGFTTGVLPCPVVLGFLAYALNSGSVADGIAVMAGLGIGTLLPLLALGTAGRLAGLHFRRWASVASGVILVLLGTGTMLRGTPLYHQLLGCSNQAAAPTPAAKPHCCSGE
ncbi:sulfite exporter TauE/SafE family protein [Geobacter sp. DSM 9736]|uniref:sulfite exporter TauE/SafE family protein n=1 Tax=Geobacter sp. DSM 9736 TaxID=1277350 RepID=UPI000B504506|nr:sulfite exporter TauE/SafE family protein [Geobacter sp. DSM 9736]SNB46679.1 hypothetical protein SAMN06269301_2149 [Geobacter sp. DSM 9736]